MDASEYSAAIGRLHRFRGLYERLYASEDALAHSFPSNWDNQGRETSLRDLRRELVRAAPEVNGDLARPGTGADLVGLRDALALGGRSHVIPLVQAIVDGTAYAYNLNPTRLDPAIEGVIAWHERMLAQVEEAEEADRSKAAERERQDAAKAARRRRAGQPRAEHESQRRWTAKFAPVRFVLSLWSDFISIGGWVVRNWPWP